MDDWPEYRRDHNMGSSCVVAAFVDGCHKEAWRVSFHLHEEAYQTTMLSACNIVNFITPASKCRYLKRTDNVSILSYLLFVTILQHPIMRPSKESMAWQYTSPVVTMANGLYFMRHLHNALVRVGAAWGMVK